MAKAIRIDIRCLHCAEWFPSPIFIADELALTISEMEKNETRCPACKMITACNKTNMRIAYDDGGFRGADTF